MLSIRYGSDESLQTAQQIMQRICHAAYRISIEIAREKASFPLFERESFLAGEFVQALPESIRDSIARYGIRNSHLIAIAPAGSISLLANNISSGLEPVYDHCYTRRVLQSDGSKREFTVTDYAVALWQQWHHDTLPPAFINAHAVPPDEQLRMQAAIQPYVDQAISKTINIPPDYDFDAFRRVYQEAYALGLKGCTVFRPNPVTGTVLDQTAESHAACYCGDCERDTD